MDKILKIVFDNKRNWGLVLIGLGFLVDGAAPFVQHYIPLPLPVIAEWLKTTGGGFAAVGGLDGVRKNQPIK